MINKVKPKKALGQHFLTDMSVARRIAETLDCEQGATLPVLEIGPGMGVLTQFLIKNPLIDLNVVEIDRESVDYLNQNFEALKGRIISDDFLKISLENLFEGADFCVIGNYPYNISSQIFFKVLECRFFALTPKPNRIGGAATIFNPVYVNRVVL
mgnify:CR=1 FL=1